MPNFRAADREANDLIAEIARTYPDLVEADVTIGCRFAYSAKGFLPALRLHNWNAAAIVRVVSQKDRVSGMPDAMIDVDGLLWGGREEDRRRAVLHHEVHHIQVVRDKNGRIKFDDCDRPRLRLRPHDFQLGGFDDIITKYGRAALEAEAAIDLNRRLTQREFQWG